MLNPGADQGKDLTHEKEAVVSVSQGAKDDFVAGEQIKFFFCIIHIYKNMWKNRDRHFRPEAGLKSQSPCFLKNVIDFCELLKKYNIE